MRTIVISTQYKKDLKLARKRGLPEEKLNEIVFQLANDEPLPPVNRDHILVGNKDGIWECHILQDWLLLYSKSDKELQIIVLCFRLLQKFESFLIEPQKY